MRVLYISLILIAVLLISGCTQQEIKTVKTISPPAFSPAETTPPKFTPQETASTKLTDLESKLVGTWSVARAEYKAEQGGIWPIPEHIDKIAIKSDKTWEDDKSSKGTWSVETIVEIDWENWGVSWDTSADKPDKKIVLKGSEPEISGWIEKHGSRDYFWLIGRFSGEGETPSGWTQLYFEKTSDVAKVEPKSSSSPPAFNPSTDPEVAKTVNVPDIESKLRGEWGFGTSRKLVLHEGGAWELLPEAGGSSGMWELKDVTRSDIDKLKEDEKISDPSQIISKKLVFYDRKCSGQIPETEEVFIPVQDGEISFGSCGIAWVKL